MKREIKFRAWVGANGKMEYNDFYIHQKTGLCHYWSDTVGVGNNAEFYDCGEEEPILMQYTGYKDKNGKEIYEGDILSLWYSRDSTGTDIVKFTQDVEFGENNGFSGYEIPFLENAEIIGNVYETPELSDSRHEA